MKRWSEPLRGLLVPDAEEDELRAIWRGVVSRRSRAESQRFRMGIAVRLMLAATALTALLFGAYRFWQPPASLHELSGRSLNVIGGKSAEAVALSDGSRIELAPNSELQVLTNDSELFSTVLRHGRGVFEVNPEGKRRWLVEAIGVRVEVTGTRFIVERGDDRTLVKVERGTVIVRGERVPFGAQKLGAGELLLVGDQPLVAGIGTSAAPIDSASKAEPIPKLEQPVATRPATPTLAQADEARRRGDLDDAVKTLNAIANGPRSAQRPMAAFTMGKLLLDDLGRPAAAVAAFSKCLALAPPAAVAEDASARLVEAYARSGQKALASAAAAEYLKRYPGGRRKVDVQRWAGGI